VDPGPCYTALTQMIQDNKLSRVHPFNVLLALEVRRMSFRRVFALYRFLRRRHGNIQPNAATFCTMFKALDVWHPGLAPRNPRPNGRELFQQMILLHHSATKGAVYLRTKFLTANALNVSLKYFMHVRDYAAAMVVLRTFGVCRRVPTARTELVVFSAILRRMKNEIETTRGAMSFRWVDAMRGSTLDPRQNLEELNEIRNELRRMKQRSDLGNLVPSSLLVPSSKEFNPNTGSTRSKYPWKRKTMAEDVRSGSRVSLARARVLVRCAFDADRQQYSRSHVESIFEGDLAIACKEMLPPGNTLQS
jgi:hypothetical protein